MASAPGGNYKAAFQITSDLGNHGFFFALQQTILTIAVQNGVASLQTDNLNAGPVSGMFDEETCSFSGGNSGPLVGIPEVQYRWVVRSNPITGMIEGEYVAGEGGNLPPGHGSGLPIFYSFMGHRQE